MYKITPEEQARLDKDFTYHSTKSDQVPRYNMIRDCGGTFAFVLLENCPPSRERSLAMTALEECVMWANAAIARNE